MFVRSRLEYFVCVCVAKQCAGFIFFLCEDICAAASNVVSYETTLGKKKRPRSSMRYVKKKEVPNSPYIDIIYTCTIPSMFTVIERFNGGGEVKETYTLFTEIGHGITSRVYRVHEDPLVVIKVFLSHIDFGAERRIITRMMPSDTKVYKGTVQSMDSGKYGILMYLCTPIHISLHPGKSRLLEE